MPDTGIIFLGVCERANYVPDGDTGFFKWHILGLKQVILSPIFPLPFQATHFGFAISAEAIATPHHIQIVDPSGNERGTIHIRIQNPANEPISSDSIASAPPEAIVEAPAVMLVGNGWQAIFCTIGPPGFLIERPGIHYLRLETPAGPQIIGELHFYAVNAIPLTPDRVAAIRSDPRGSKVLRLEFSCKVCSTALFTYAALERIPSIEAEGCSWYETIPETFTCTCSQTTLDLSLIRKNLHALLGLRIDQGGPVSVTPLYEKSSLEALRIEFVALVKTATKEEQLQQFIAKNPVILHQFPAVRLFTKPPIFTFFKADFAIVTPQRELLLIELEKSTTTLLKQDGGVAATLNQAFDQARSWLHIADEQRIAVLDALSLTREQVSSVHAVVIAGQDSGYDAMHLRRLKGQYRGDVRFLTYDDLIYSLDHLIQRLDAL